MLKAEFRSSGRIFMTAAALLLTAGFVTGGARQNANNGQKYSASLLTTQFAKDPKYFRYPDGRQQLTYTTENEYPADDVLSFLKAELKKQGWIPLSKDFLNPDIPSSNQRGWAFFEDQTQKPSTGVWQWVADWENNRHDVTSYTLMYESPTNSTRNLTSLHITALDIPTEIAAKMKRDVHPK